jgi:hypothetical protein
VTLKFVGFPRQHREMTDPIVTRTALKEITKSQRRQCGVAASAATLDNDPVVIDNSLRCEEFSAVDTVIDVDDIPVEM